MERLSGLDASFLYLETPTLHMHVSMVVVVDPSSIPGGYRFERFRDLVSDRLVTAPVFRRRLVPVPFGLGHPYWVEDADFDIDYHLRRAALPQPGGMDELADLVSDLSGRQLDRARPLWQMYVIEGLAGGHLAVMTKIHHATIDGVSGAELLGRLFDLAPLGSTGEAGEDGGASEDSGSGEDGGTSEDGGTRKDGGTARGPRSGASVTPAAGSGVAAGRITSRPPDALVLARALVDRATRPLEASRMVLRTGRAVIDLARLRRSAPTGSAPGALPLTGPRTSLNASITPHRKVAFASTSLDDVKRVKRHLGCTVNDVVLAQCTGALRRYLTDRGELPDEPLVAMVPVSVAPDRARSMHGSNKVSAMWVALPCADPDPLGRVASIRSATKGAKEEYRALGADVLVNWTEHASPNLFSAAARMYSRFRLADHHRPIQSVIVSNVPGPDFPIYLGGAETVAAFPLGPITDGAGLNITVMSYRGALNWGLMACRETVPTVDALAGHLHDALAELLAACDLGEPTPVGIAARPTSTATRPRRTAARRSAATTGTAARRQPSRTQPTQKRPSQTRPSQEQPAGKESARGPSTRRQRALERSAHEPSGNEQPAREMLSIVPDGELTARPVVPNGTLPRT